VFRKIEDSTGKHVIDESGNSAVKLHVRDHMSMSGGANALLDRISKQTSLTFSRESREMGVWFMVDSPGGAPATQPTKTQ
jgi:hypothetical protein